MCLELTLESFRSRYVLDNVEIMEDFRGKY